MTASGPSGETHFVAKGKWHRLLYLAALGTGVVLGLLS